MTVFEHSFSLIGLILGLALVEILGTLTRTVRQRGIARIGWLTLLLAVFIILDVTTFWAIVYEVRNMLPSIWQTLGAAVILSSAYYVAASMAFPLQESEWDSLDDYFMRNRRIIFGLMLVVYIVTLVAQSAMGISFRNLANPFNIAYLGLLFFTALVPYRRACIAGLGGLILVDALTFVI